MKIRLALTLNISRATKPVEEPEPPYVADAGVAQAEINQQQTWFGEDTVGFKPNPPKVGPRV